VQCHGADTGLIAQCYTVAGMAFPRESVERHRGVTPRRQGRGARPVVSKH
jgi:hypothetical protein